MCCLELSKEVFWAVFRGVEKTSRHLDFFLVDQEFQSGARVGAKRL